METYPVEKRPTLCVQASNEDLLLLFSQSESTHIQKPTDAYTIVLCKTPCNTKRNTGQAKRLLGSMANQPSPQ